MEEQDAEAIRAHRQAIREKAIIVQVENLEDREVEVTADLEVEAAAEVEAQAVASTCRSLKCRPRTDSSAWAP